ncbi:MAG: hypothetical protein AAF549_00970 [Pseudomonadota bacterium]
MLILRNLILVSLFLIGAIGINQSHAMIGIDLEKLKPLTQIDYMPRSDFEDQTKVVEDIPYDDRFLSFQVRLPADFKMSEGDIKLDIDRQLGKRVLGVVTKYISAPRNYIRSLFTIEALELTYEISARNWFINYVVSNGLTLEQVGDGDDNGVEAIYIEIKGDQTYIVRVRAIKNGPRMIIARYYLPQEFYDEQRVMQAQVIRSFKLNNKEDVGIEELEVYGFLDQSYFKYPQSWNIKVPYIRSINRMQAVIYNDLRQNRLDGQIAIYLTNKSVETTREAEIEYYRDLSQVEDYVLGNFIEEIELKYHPDINYGITEVYAYNSQQSNLLEYELWFTFLEGKDYFYVLTLLTPSREDDFYIWSRNSEAFKIVAQEIRRSGEGLDYYEFIQ